MPNLTQLGTNGPFLGSTYSVVIFTDDDGQTWIHHHTDKTRSYKTDWSAQKVAETIADTKQESTNKSYSDGWKRGQDNIKLAHNRRKWWQRIKKMQ
jgi:hypothetical protein